MNAVFPPDDPELGAQHQSPPSAAPRLQKRTGTAEPASAWRVREWRATRLEALPHPPTPLAHTI